MRNSGPLFLLAVLIVLPIYMLGCGGSNRQLQSVTISPSTANSATQFTATGSYSDGSQVTPLPALWFTIRPWYNAANPVQFFILDGNGDASCNGNGGTFAVVATAPIDPSFPLSQMSSTTPQVVGTAQFTCP